MEVTPNRESDASVDVGQGHGEMAECLSVADPRGSRLLTTDGGDMASDDEMSEAALQDEFSRLCGKECPEALQEQGRRQQAELEELIRIKRQLAEREDEVARLRRQLVASGTPAKAGADEYSAEGPRQQWTVRAVDDRRALEDNDSPRSRESGRNATEELAAGRVDGTRTAMIVPAVLRVLKKAKRWQRTEVFYYWDFQDLHAGRTFMFDRRIKDVILVLPPAETGVGSWTALVDAVAVWLGAGGRVFLIAGPRTGDDTAWMRVTTQAREFLEKHLKPASHAQICDMLPRGMDVVDMNAPCAVLGIIENEELMVALKRACAFYMACRKQLSPWTQMEALPEVPRRRPPSVDKYPGIRSGRIGKRRCRSPPARGPLRVRH